MNRIIKFRAWDKSRNRMIFVPTLNFGEGGESVTVMVWDKTIEGFDNSYVVGESCELMQFTGLKDKGGLAEIYEGDIIDAQGLIKGNIHESPQIYEEGIDCLIEGMGTSAWRDTESVAMGRGCKYAQ